MKERPDVGVYIKDLIGYVVNNADDMDKIMMVGHKNSKQRTKKLKTKHGFISRCQFTRFWKNNSLDNTLYCIQLYNLEKLSFNTNFSH